MHGFFNSYKYLLTINLHIFIHLTNILSCMFQMIVNIQFMDRHSIGSNLDLVLCFLKQLHKYPITLNFYNNKKNVIL